MARKDIRPALRAFLLADATVSATVGGARIFPIRIPQGIKAASLVLNEISGEGDHHNEGASGLVRVRMQIAAWAPHNPALPAEDVSHALFLAVKDVLDGFGRGVMGSGPAAVNVQGVFIDSWRDVEDTEAGWVGKSADYFFNYEEL